MPDYCTNAYTKPIVPQDAHIFADAGYLDQDEEALLQDAGLHLVAQPARSPYALYGSTPKIIM